MNRQKQRVMITETMSRSDLLVTAFSLLVQLTPEELAEVMDGLSGDGNK